MKHARVTYLLVLSLLVNLGVLAAAAWQSTSHADAVDVARSLELKEDQRQRWDALETSFVAELDTGWRDIARHRERLIREVFADQPDAARVEAERARIAELQVLQQKRVIAQFDRERALLTPEQRRRLVDLLLRERQPASRERQLHGS